MTAKMQDNRILLKSRIRKRYRQFGREVSKIFTLDSSSSIKNNLSMTSPSLKFKAPKKQINKGNKFTSQHILRMGLKFNSSSDFLKYLHSSETALAVEKTTNLPSSKYILVGIICVILISILLLYSSDHLSSLGFKDIPKLQSILIDQKKKKCSASSPSNKNSSQAMLSLEASRFRYINELIYSQTGAQSLKMFCQDEDAFAAYHTGYSAQLLRWPQNPLNLIIAYIIKNCSDKDIIADFGCGNAYLARHVPNRVYSFDFVALNDRVTACDMAHTGLTSNCVDVAVFCLSLMGTNIKDFLVEANRVLKNQSGILIIAEISSRFRIDNFDQDSTVSMKLFIDYMKLFGFQLTSQEYVGTRDYFHIFYFIKNGTIRKKLPDIKLGVCKYKRR